MNSAPVFPEPRRRRVLFVDDERDVLDGIQDKLQPRRRTWQLVFVDRAEAALEEMARAPFDVIVSDLRMPRIPGEELLTLVKERHPSVARIALTGHTEQTASLNERPVAQQFLTKPCDPATLCAAIERTDELNKLLRDEGLRRMIASLQRLPSVPAIYSKLDAAIRSSAAGVPEIAAIVETDPAMAAKVLQVANSAFFAGSGTATASIQGAVSRLGFEIMKGLVLGAHAFGMAQGSGIGAPAVAEIQRRSLEAARVCRRLVGGGKSGEEAFTCGLLHDVGRLVLGLISPSRFLQTRNRALEEKRPLESVELEALGVTHAELGAYLLGLWGLPFDVVEAVAFHHSPARVAEGQRQLLAALHVTGALIDAQTEDEAIDRIDRDFLVSCGVRDWTTSWLKLAREERAAMAAPESKR